MPSLPHHRMSVNNSQAKLLFEIDSSFDQSQTLARDLLNEIEDAEPSARDEMVVQESLRLAYVASSP